MNVVGGCQFGRQVNVRGVVDNCRQDAVVRRIVVVLRRELRYPASTVDVDTFGNLSGIERT